MPRMIATSIAKAIATNWFCPASVSSSDENRVPTPVSAITPTITPAAAQTATICSAMRAAISSPQRISFIPIRVGVSQLTAAAAAIDSVPARITE